jgi:Acetyltransferases, including N-acetylases of ribosomal proteins
MLSLSIEDKDLTIRDIDKLQIDKITCWFNSNIEKYKYAMGTSKQFTSEDFYEKYLEVLINAHEFFLGINMDGELIGFVKGRADYKNEGEIWIMSMLIGAPYQSRGIGSRALDLIIDEFNKKLGIKKFYACLVNDNIRGKAFWKRNSFSEYRSAKDFFTIDNKSYDMVIMNRVL